MKYLIVIFLVLISLKVQSQELYLSDKVMKMELQFYNSNYKQLLEQNRLDEIDLPAQLILNDTLVLDSVGVRYKGNSSYNIPNDKKSFNISIDAFREEQRLLDYKTLNLNNGFVDPTFMRENIVHRIYSKYLPALKTGFVYLYINGEEYGLYSNVQQINKDFLGEWYDYKSGNLYKGDPRGELTWKGSDASLYKGDYEKKTNEAEDDWSDLVTLINAINNSANLEQDLPEVLNTDRALWYFALSNIFVNLDSYIFSSHNYYLYNNPSSSLYDFLPWDLNESFGTFPPDLPFKKEEFPIIDLKSPNRNPLLKNMMANNNYKQIFLAHYRTLFNEYFNQDSIGEIIGEIKPVIDSYVQKDPKKLYSYSDFNKNITEDVSAQGRTVLGILNFVNNRRSYLLKQPDFQKTSPKIKSVKCISDSLFAGNDAVFNVEMTSTNTKKVNLHYRLGKGNFQKVEMFDDGNHNDSKAGDKIYGVSVAISEYCKENQIDFYATATNTADVMKFVPERAEFEFLSKEIIINQIGHSIVINEFMAANTSTIADENGGYADWIELRNNGGVIKSLNGWFLTDDINKKTKWKFPQVTINQRGYMILWADEDEEQGELHTNFKLSKNGEYIGLYDADTNLIDCINYTAQTEDISFGRYPNGYGDFRLMDIPTPGAENKIDLSKDTLPPVPVWKMDCCGNVNLEGKINLWDMPQDSNRSNLSTIVTMIDNYRMDISSFNLCVDSAASWSLITEDCTKDASAWVTFHDCAGNDTTIHVNYYAPNLSFSPELIDFGICQTDMLYERQIVLRNNSDMSEPVITDISLKNNISTFSILDENYNQLTFPVTIASLDSLMLIIRFSASDLGQFADSIIVVDTCLNSISASYLTAETGGTGIDDDGFPDGLLIAPNPASDYITLRTNRIIGGIRIFDVLGNERHCKLSESGDWITDKLTIDTSELNNGIYIIQIKNSGNIITRSFVICR
ncbi:MAG: CotH kinase family protein [bacterium]